MEQTDGFALYLSRIVFLVDPTLNFDHGTDGNERG
jgi:hypothetical protein